MRPGVLTSPGFRRASIEVDTPSVYHMNAGGST
jgi:hypothetical protein